MIGFIAPILLIICIVLLFYHCKSLMPPLPNWAQMLVLGVLIVSAVFTIVFTTGRIVSACSANNHKETYETLILYKDVVEASNDELLRYDFYNRVKEWNDSYNDYLRTLNNTWINYIVSPHSYEGCDVVHFELRRS